MFCGRKSRIVVLVLAAVFFCCTGFVQAYADSAGKSTEGVMASAKIADKTHSDVTKDTIVIIGASYAAGLGMDTLAGRRIINKGVGGEQSFETLARFDREVIADKPDAVILWGFINDIFRSERDKVDAAVERIKSSYTAMVEKARQNGIKPILATEVTMSRRPGIKAWVMRVIGAVTGKTSYQEYINGHVMDVNQWLKAFAKENDVPVLDLQVLLAEGDIMRKTKYAQEDASHISDEGYQVIAEYIRSNLPALN